MTTTGGVYINDKCIMRGDTTGPASAKILLTDKTVDTVVLETARGGIIRSGLGYDLADVGVLTNISEDHLGLDGVNSLEDMLHVKSLVTEAVKSNGYVVLNADDHMVIQAAKQTKANIIYFSMQEDNLIVHRHIAEAVLPFAQGQLHNSRNRQWTVSLSIMQIPATFGEATHNIEIVWQPSVLLCPERTSSGY